MRDLLKIVAAGAVLSAYAALIPSVVEAVPAQGDKAFTHRLPQAGGAGPVSARIETVSAFDARRPLVVGFSAGGASR